MKKYIAISSILLLLVGCNSQKLVYSEKFKTSDLKTNWEILVDQWHVTNQILYGEGTRPDWSVIVNKKELPQDYILEFSSWLETDERLFEIILNLNDGKFVGLLMNYLGATVELEGRSLYDKDGRVDIRTTPDMVGKLPNVNFPKKDSWNQWTIQKTGDKLFVLIDGEEVIKLNRADLLKDGGQFGFVTSGQVKIKDIKLKTSKKSAPKKFKGKADNRFFFLFGE